MWCGTTVVAWTFFVSSLLLHFQTFVALELPTNGFSDLCRLEHVQQGCANVKETLQNHYIDDSGMAPWQESSANCMQVETMNWSYRNSIETSLPFHIYDWNFINKIENRCGSGFKQCNEWQRLTGLKSKVYITIKSGKFCLRHCLKSRYPWINIAKYFRLISGLYEIRSLHIS